MLIINNISTPLGQPEEAAIERALKKAKIKPSQVREAYVSKTSLDARRQRDIRKVNTVTVRLFQGEEALAARIGDPAAVRYQEERPFALPEGGAAAKGPVVIAGFGPAGIFAADLLTLCGVPVTVLERGGPVEEREKAVEAFWKTGSLDSSCNVQFGEGGAGTFSDGKLTTRISDPLCGYVLERFASHGAPPEILRKAKPHIGTDRLRQVVKSLREEIRGNGGDIRFHSRLEDILVRDGRLTGVRADGEELPAAYLILAVGHSARDTFRMLAEKGVFLESKPFSVGARIEHRQETIDRGLYGSLAGHPDLPPGEYQLSHRVGDRAAYTFCMCPGGVVVPAASGEGQVVTNGMSCYRRDGENANAALAVSVDARDFGGGVFDGVRFQEGLEQRAFALAGKGYRACGADVGSFLAEKPGLILGKVRPSYALGLEAVDFDRLFPAQITEMLRAGLRRFDRMLPGFAGADAILIGPETRTSSPVRITRGEDCQSLTVKGLYPAGRGRATPEGL